jgi:GLPGLI family protein
MRKYIILLFTVLYVGATAQSPFLLKGKIEFEKRVNLHSNMSDDSWTDLIKKTIPKQRVTYFDLFFDSTQSLYKPGREIAEPVKIPDWIIGPAADNIVYMNSQRGNSVAVKNVFESAYLISDSLRNCKWKITNDTREIAGFKCRKATTLIMDSVFVVAFYTDKIVPQFGPESFNGLPGMILGLAIPRLFTTWYATKVELQHSTPVQAPSRGKKATNDELLVQLKSVMKNAGTRGPAVIWQIML